MHCGGRAPTPRLNTSHGVLRPAPRRRRRRQRAPLSAPTAHRQLLLLSRGLLSPPSFRPRPGANMSTSRWTWSPCVFVIDSPSTPRTAAVMGCHMDAASFCNCAASIHRERRGGCGTPVLLLYPAGACPPPPSHPGAAVGRWWQSG